jgi:hypothetical protein
MGTRRQRIEEEIGAAQLKLQLKHAQGWPPAERSYHLASRLHHSSLAIITGRV